MAYEWKSLQADYSGNLHNALADNTLRTLVIDVSETLTQNEEVKDNVRIVFIKGNLLAIPANTSLTIKGTLDAGAFQIFDEEDPTSEVIIWPSACVYLLPEWWGAISNGVVNCQPAFQSAVNSSDRTVDAVAPAQDYIHNKPILLIGRQYFIDGKVTSRQAALFIGQGARGANERVSTTIYHGAAGNCFEWDAGENTSGLLGNSAVGGGLRNLIIIKQAHSGNNDGGAAIYLKGRTDAYRPTDFLFENILVSADEVTDIWDHIMHVDGTAVNVQNGDGVRNLMIVNFRCGGGRGGEDYPQFLLQQVVNFAALNIGIDPAAGVGDAIMKFTHKCDTINLSGCAVSGILHFDTDANSVCRAAISGKFKTKVQVSSTANVAGTANVYTEALDLPAGCRLNVIGGDVTNYFTRVSVGTTASAGMLQVDPASAGTIGVVVRAAPSQTANLQEWRNNTSDVMAKVGPSGLFTFTAASTLTVTPAITTTTTVGAKDSRLLLINNSVTSLAGGEVVLGMTGDTPRGRYAVIGADIRTNSSGDARGDVYIATKANIADTTLTRRLIVFASGNVTINDNGQDPLCKLHVHQGTLGDVVLRLTSSATNDDPQFDVREYRITTTDGSTATLGTIAIAASKTYLLEARVVARRTGGTAGTADDGAVYIRRCMVTTKGGTVTISSVQDALTQEDQPTLWNCTFEPTNPASANVWLRVLGATDNTVTWHATVFIQEVGS